MFVCNMTFRFSRFAIIWKKGYQEFDVALSAITTKLKGTALVNFTGFKSPLVNGMHIFDPADYVIPPQASRNLLFLRVPCTFMHFHKYFRNCRCTFSYL